MKVTLSPSYELTNEHAASSYGQPVLVNRDTGEAYGPGDVLHAFPSWSDMPAKKAVERMAKANKFTYVEQRLVDRFVGE